MTDAVKMATEWLRACSDWLLTNDLDMQMPDGVLDTDPLDIADALEQAGEPVDVALLDRAELAWQRFFYPAADCFTGPAADKLPSVDLEVADCLRLVLAAVGRLVVTPEADVPAPLPTLQRLGQEFDAGEASEGLREAIAATEYKYFGDYEMSDAQRKAVDVLVDHARASLALKADNRSSMERLGDILRGSSFKPNQKYLGAAFLGYDYARRYYAHPPQSRGQAFDGEGEELAEAVRCIMARCEALEDEASNGIATTSANVRDDTHEAGFWRGQKSTAKSIREHLHDMTRAALSEARENTNG